MLSYIEAASDVLIERELYDGCIPGNAIKCWECKSHADPLCADPFDNTTLPITECNRRYLPHLPNLIATMCRKVRQKVSVLLSRDPLAFVLDV